MDLNFVVMKNPLSLWLLFFSSGLGIWILFLFIRRKLIKNLPRFERKDNAIAVVQFFEIFVRSLRPWILGIFAFSLSGRQLEYTPTVDLWLGRLTVVALLIQLGLVIDAVIQFSRQEKMGLFRKSPITLGLISFVARSLVWILVFLLILDNLGVQITALVAGLGVGGIAIALAVQNILGDLFASMTIALDQPFEVGDFIVVDDYMGTVERVGIKTTRVRSLSGEELIFSNGDLLKSRLRNFKRMRERRAEFRFGLVYGTSPEKIDWVNRTVKSIIEKQKQVRFERCHFKALSNTSLEFEVVYWVTDPDFNLFMDIQQNINTELFSAFLHEEVYFSLAPSLSSKPV